MAQIESRTKFKPPTYFLVEILEKKKKEELWVIPVAKPIRILLGWLWDGNNKVCAIGVPDARDLENIVVLKRRIEESDNPWETRVITTIIPVQEFERKDVERICKMFKCHDLTLTKVLRL